MADLTQDILSKVLGMGNLPYSPTTNIGGTNYQAAYRNNAQGEAGQGQEGGLDQIIGYDPSKTAVGDLYSMYDPTGKFSGQGQFKKVKDGDLITTGLLSAALMHFGLPMLQGAGGAGATIPGAGASEALAAEAALGAGPGAGLGNFGSLAGIEGAGGLAPTLGAEAAGGIGSFAAPGLDVAAGLAGTAPEFAGMSGFAGSLGSAGGFGGASLLPAMAAGANPGKGLSLGGLATTALGGLLGSKGQEAEGSTTKKLDPRLDPYVYGDSGVLVQANKLMQQQLAQGGLNDLQRQGMQRTQDWLTSPQYSQGFNQMQNLGLGLLGRGIASNPFAK